MYFFYCNVVYVVYKCIYIILYTELWEGYNAWEAELLIVHL